MLGPHDDYGYFQPRETRCKCGCGLDIQPELRTALNTLRQRVGAPLVVVSGARCLSHNRRVGGASRSLHLVGLAADIRWPSASSVTRPFLIKIVQGVGFTGIGTYPSFIHVDLRHLRSMPSARWSE